ncbi:porin [Rhizobacter sp. LjRoot28]|uniref:porin n=1 Tax=Rhizobacter sp. LjRoot28 TaxID=3342309 RepID=UPI003ECC9E4B
MKKSLLALVVLGAFAGAASAQSSVTIFGKIDQAVGKPIGTKDKQVFDTAGSRIAFRGYEDLGGGMGALFAFEHRFAPDTGNYGGGAAPVAATTTRFWEGFSFVGLRTPYGALTLGRQYTSSFLTVQNQIDPFAGETVAKLRDIGMGHAAGAPAAGAPGQIRVADSVKYALTASGFTFSADIAEATGADRPYSVAGSYQGGPFWVGIAYEDPTGVEDELLNVGARYTFGTVTLSGGVAEGKRNTPTNNKVRGYLVGANIAVGTGDIKIGYADLKIGGVKLNQRTGLGYHHNLSKRTKLFVDVAHDSKATTPAGDPEKIGYDIGLQHNF